VLLDMVFVVGAGVGAWVGGGRAVSLAFEPFCVSSTTATITPTPNMIVRAEMIRHFRLCSAFRSGVFVGWDSSSIGLASTIGPNSNGDSSSSTTRAFNAAMAVPGTVLSC
jgi:hypothetical protein